MNIYTLGINMAMMKYTDTHVGITMFMVPVIVSMVRGYVKRYIDEYNTQAGECDICEIIKTDNKYVIEMSVGGGFWAYYQGVMSYIHQTYDLSECILVGYSAGVIPATSFRRKDPIELMPAFRKFCKVIDGKLTKMLWNWVRESSAVTREFINKDDNINVLNKDTFYYGVAEYVPSWKTGMRLQTRYLSNFKTVDALVRGQSSAYTIPFITWFGLYTKVNNRYFIDDGLISKRTECTAINKTTGDPLVKTKIWPTKWRKQPLTDYFLTGDADTIDRLYWLGYNDAKKNRSDINLPLK